MRERNTNQVRDGLERNLRQAIQALALSPKEQIQVLSPGCITCELYEDFKSARNFYVDSGYLNRQQNKPRYSKGLINSLKLYRMKLSNVSIMNVLTIPLGK